MELNEIKIRNAYSIKRDLILVYKEGKKRKLHRIKGFFWYVIIKTVDWKKNKNKLISSGLIKGFVELGDYTKIQADKSDGKWSDATSLIKVLDQYEIEHFEGDLHTAKRFLVDNEMEVSSEYDILYFDIETDDTNRKIEIGATRILSFGAIDNNGRSYYFDDDDEKVLIKKALKLFLKYDIITGWNIDDFDIPYLEKRWEQFSKSKKRYKGSLVPWHKVAKIDMLRRARKLFKEDASLKSYSLENVSQHFLKKGKIKFEGKVVDLDKETLQKYNMHDVELLKELDEKTGMIDLIAKECVMAKCLIRDFAGVYVSVPLDMMILREAHKEGIWCPSKKVVGEEVNYVGGLVFDPEIGYHKNVYVFDFTSLYPSIIMTSNIGFDTLVKERKEGGWETIKNPGTGADFLKSRESVVSKVVRQLVEERQSYKKLRLDLVAQGKMESEEYTQARANEIIVKELSNSVYGIMGNQALRYYDTKVAESITKTGHWLLNFTKDFFNDYPYFKVIYGDTDSVFVSSMQGDAIVEMLVENVLGKYHQKLQDSLREFGIDRSYINLKYEKLFSGMILVKKKYYTGRVINIEGKKVNEFVAKGIDLVKKATFPMVVKAQRKLIDMILDGEDELKIKAFVDKELFRLNNDRFGFDELKISTGINKDLKDYKMKNAPHVKLARAHFEEKGELEIREMEYVVIDDKAPKDSLEGLATREQFTGEFDRIYYWNQKVWPPLLRILEATFPKVEWDNIYSIPIVRKKQRVSKNQLSLFPDAKSLPKA